MAERPPWADSRFRWLRRANGSFDVIDIGGATWDDHPEFVANCETVEQARRVVEAFDSDSEAAASEPTAQSGDTK